MSEHQTRSFVRALREEVARCAGKDQLLMFARRWLYEHEFLIKHDRALRAHIVSSLQKLERETAGTITNDVPPHLLEQWRQSLAQIRPDGQTQQSWL